MANDGCNSWVYDSCMIGNSNAQHFRQLAWRFRQISHVYACCYPLNVGILRKDNTKTIEQNTQRHIQLNVMAWCVYNSCHSMPKCGNIYDILMCLLILFLISFCWDECRWTVILLFVKTPQYAKWLKPIGWLWPSILPITIDEGILLPRFSYDDFSVVSQQLPTSDICSKKQQTRIEQKKKWEFICGNIICCFMTKQNSTIRHMYYSTAFHLTSFTDDFAIQYVCCSSSTISISYLSFSIIFSMNLFINL